MFQIETSGILPTILPQNIHIHIENLLTVLG